MYRVALSGKMKSGKSTLAAELLARYLFNVISFADPIRNALRVLGINKDVHPDLYRAGAQYIGTDLVRAQYPNWWVDQMDKRIEYMQNEYIVIDDMRFENEYDFCKANDFLMVRLQVSPETQLTRGAQPAMLDHASETGLDAKDMNAWDIWIPENTSIEQRLLAVRSRLDSISLTGSVPVRA